MQASYFAGFVVVVAEHGNDRNFNAREFFDEAAHLVGAPVCRQVTWKDENVGLAGRFGEQRDE